MANAKRDNNGVTTITGVLNTNGTTVTNASVSAGHVLDIDDNTTGSDFGSDNASRDANQVTTLLAVSEVDGVTLVPVYINASGQVMVDST